VNGQSVKIHFESPCACNAVWHLMVQGMSFQDAAERLELHEFTDYYAVLAE
jgi:hypothetical protein